MGVKLNARIAQEIAKAQRNEFTEHLIYERLARSEKDPENKAVLERISNEELEHSVFWKQFTEKDMEPSKPKIWKYTLTSKIFGITFAIKLMEMGEENAQVDYGKIADHIPEARRIVQDENRHEEELISLIDEERLRYVGSMVVGLNDALIELTGALAGFTLAFQDTRIAAMAGLITGIAGALSMTASEYLTTRTEGGEKIPRKASFYTGSTYILVVALLILPFLLFSNLFLCLTVMILDAIIVIFVFTYYISVARDIPFKRRFAEMLSISLGIAALTFIIGLLVRIFLNINM
jgi:VIT1/CCC1 family predicted Fe2+/Mn2+ transporter